MTEKLNNIFVQSINKGPQKHYHYHHHKNQLQQNNTIPQTISSDKPLRKGSDSQKKWGGELRSYIAAIEVVIQ